MHMRPPWTHWQNTVKHSLKSFVVHTIITKNAITKKDILRVNEIDDKIKEQKAVAIFDTNR